MTPPVGSVLLEIHPIVERAASDFVGMLFAVAAVAAVAIAIVDSCYLGWLIILLHSTLA